MFTQFAELINRIKTNDYNTIAEYDDRFGRIANTTTEYNHEGYTIQFQDVATNKTFIHGKHFETRTESLTWARVWDGDGDLIFKAELSKYGARLNVIRFLENY